MKLYILILLIAFLFATNAQSATLTVTKTADSNDGICNSDCSLREAITQAANNDVVVFDDLVFSGAATIRVSLGQILISKNISIVGTNAKSLVILATQASGIPLYRAIEFGSASVLISNVTISAVTTPTQTPVDYGGGILNQGDLQLVNVKISGNRASEGGGICNFGTLRASNTTITNNTATHANNRGQGGGISNGGTMILTNTTVSGNIATSEQVGIGGIGGRNFPRGLRYGHVV